MSPKRAPFDIFYTTLYEILDTFYIYSIHALYILFTNIHSLDNITNHNGGLIDEMLPHGACQRPPELDEACFEVPLGHVAGPIETDYVYHLLLVEERTNCGKLDGLHSKIARGGTCGAKTVYVNGEKGGNNFLRLPLELLIILFL